MPASAPPSNASARSGAPGRSVSAPATSRRATPAPRGASQPPGPEELRRSGYDYVIAYLRHHLGAASLLRLDHVMGLHRLYWVPHGATARGGGYVRHRPG